MDNMTKRILSGAGALIIAVAILIGGTFAYTLYEHKSNVQSSNIDYQVRLVEDFESNNIWAINKSIKKQISVKNMGGTEQFKGDNWGNVYVRLQLKEHMDITPVEYVYYPEENATEKTRFMINKQGDFVKFPADDTIENSLDVIRDSSVWQSVIENESNRENFVQSLKAEDFVKIKGYYDSEYYWYLVTKEGDPNGQYGAFVVVDKINDPSKRINITDSERASDVDYSQGIVSAPQGHDTQECLYPVHKWGSECSFETHKYVRWDLGADVIMIYDWDGEKIDKWILDPQSGFATWGNAIEPGETTSLLMESITPISQTDGEMLYVIHTEMQATDLAEMGEDWIIKGIFEDGEKELEQPSEPDDKLIIHQTAPDGGPHMPAGKDDSTQDIESNFWVYGYVFPGDRIDLTHNGATGTHFGGIKLSDITTGDYSDIRIDYEALAQITTAFNSSNLYIGQLHGEDCIVWAYAPTITEFDEFLLQYPTAELYYMDLAIPLTNGVTSGSIDVRMMYSSGCYWFT